MTTEFERLSVINRICVELGILVIDAIENHLDLHDKTLAEFIFQLYEQSKSNADFKRILEENGGL